ncbi:hypothetical protein SEPCBS119000_003689 [Sporothrix epigloea]|uniref:Aminoglycoside phosphotransferase domain-containing protein n=1 Tax=Sporothrix epigloea TaxID=1892477 RepID=A0ABP0DN15_9PEZI
MVSVARIPQPRIGSFRFNDNGTITLTGRPNLCAALIFEREGALRTTELLETYGTSDTFCSDLLRLHENYFAHNPSAADDEGDCRSEMAVKAIMRTVAHHFISKEQRSGPFRAQFTDINPSNIIVDDDWNITCLLDLGEVSILPVEMLTLPFWLSGCSIADLCGEGLTRFEPIRDLFMQKWISEEKATSSGHELSESMSRMWQSQGVWFWESLSSVNAAFYMVIDHLCPKFMLPFTTTTEELFCRTFADNSDTIVRQKVEDYTQYAAALKKMLQ